MRFIREIEGGVEITIKAVPGASRDRIVGPLGDALKVQVSAPPEKGKANQAIVALIAKTLGVSARSVSVTRGGTTPRKTIQIAGRTIEDVRTRLSM